MHETQRPGVVDVSAGKHAVLRPLPMAAFEFGEGFWAQHQRAEQRAIARARVAMLESAGNLDNLRNAANGGGTFRGPVFMDSDVYKWLEAAAWELGRSPDAHLRQRVDEVITIVAAAQMPDGYINSYVQVTDPSARWADLAHGHELYCIGHLVQAGIAMSRATGDDTLLHIAERAVGCANAVFGAGAASMCPAIPRSRARSSSCTATPGMSPTSSSRASSSTTAVTGSSAPGASTNPRTTRTACRSASHRASKATPYAPCICWRESSTSTWKPVRRRCSQPRNGSGTTWSNTSSTSPARLGSRAFSESFGDPYELPTATAYAETCAAIGSVFWNWRMLLATGESRYADQIEWTLFNAVMCGVGLDGTSFFYENPLSSRGERAREPWFACACCPPNLMRLLASLPHYCRDG